ncbi:KAP family NTPase [Paraburkholderia sprentiae WSM5005]|uniref:KAP family NTPase n=1 Tax=Paraburkholderia sprentiae WSM5005 TaxID=754502 RepID=A0A1I9YCR2_9BURK|nr:P-loop NTPase fold protein [Paraburkholderia sprentiae]APA84095.1 KAP family NTPase [Paraburkholderia sprentiae WSM5005]
MTTSESAAFRHDQPQIVTDLYGRRSFADRLAALLALPSGSPGIVVGIEGAWGSGKTTVVRYVIESLSNNSAETPVVVEFNPWMLAGADALVEALLTELASGIGANAGAKQAEKSLAVASKILGYAGLMRHLKYLKYVPGVSLFGVAAETVGDALHRASEFASEVGETVDNAKKVVEEAEKLVAVKAGLSQRKKEVVAALKDLDRPIVVVVDDLDRLTSDEIKAVFRTIKAVADFPRVAYLLAYDRNVVAESLSDGATAGGTAYIEKIVQVAYPISPAFPWQLREHVSAEIDKLLQRIGRQLQPFEADILGKATSLVCSLLRYPRDVVRIINRLTLSLASTTGEVNAADVIVLEALFHRFPAMRDAIVENPENFTGFYWSVDVELAATDWSMFLSVSREKRREAWKNHVPTDESDCAVVTAAVKFLFPLTGDERSEEPRSHLRISELSRLIRFFAFTSVSGVQEVADIHRLLAEPQGLGDMLIDMDGRRATEMTNHMIAYFETAKQVDCDAVVESLLRSCTVDKFLSSASREYSRAVALLAACCLQRMSGNVLELVLKFVGTAPLNYGLDLLSVIGMAHGMVRGVDEHKISDAVQYVADPGTVGKAVEKWQARARCAIESGEVIEEGDIFAVLYGIGNLGASATAADAIEAFRQFCVDTPGGLVHFLEQARPLKEIQSVIFYLYVWNADEMAALVEASPQAAVFAWYIESLRREPEVRKYVAMRNGKLSAD